MLSATCILISIYLNTNIWNETDGVLEESAVQSTQSGISSLVEQTVQVSSIDAVGRAQITPQYLFVEK